MVDCELKTNRKSWKQSLPDWNIGNIGWIWSVGTVGNPEKTFTYRIETKNIKEQSLPYGNIRKIGWMWLVGT